VRLGLGGVGVERGWVGVGGFGSGVGAGGGVAVVCLVAVVLIGMRGAQV